MKLKVRSAPRGSPVLETPPFPCLSRYSAINLTSGCAFGCVYCSQGDGSVVLHTDTPALLRKELDAARKKPELVYFSPDCEPFLPDKRVLAGLYETMKLLLERGVFVLVETRSAVPDEFLSLFSKHARLVKVQVGLTSIHERVRRLLEPEAAGVAQRLACLGKLVARGVQVEVGIGPLVPDLQDSEASLEALCEALCLCGVRRGSVSFLFVDRASRSRLESLTLGPWSFKEMAARLYTHRSKELCGGGTVWLADPDYRREKFDRLRALAQARGIELKLCACNNRLKSAFPADDSPVNGADGQNGGAS